MIDWWALEQRKGMPSPQDIAKTAKKAENLPDAGDHGHVLAQFPIYGKALPPIPQGAWKQAKLTQIKLSDLTAMNGQLKRDDLIWHIKHPGQSRFAGQWNTHLQVLKTRKGDLVIIDGNHRAAALLMLGVKKDSVWLLREKDIPK